MSWPTITPPPESGPAPAPPPPRPGRRPGRDALQARNGLLVTWLRRPLRIAAAATARALRHGHRRAVAAAARELPRVLRERRVVPPDIDEAARLLQRART